MKNKTVITGEGGNFPQLNVSQKAQATGIDLNIKDENDRADVGAVVLDYFDGRLRVFVYLPEDQEPTHTVHIAKLPKKETGK